MLDGSTADFQSNDVMTSGNITTTGGYLYVNRGGDAAAAYIYMDSDAGANAATILRTGTSTRWIIGKDAVAESGSDSGSNFFINRYNDSGVSQGYAFEIKRSSGDVVIGGNLLAGATVGNATTGAVGIPGGTTAQRATPGTYNLRYNTDDSSFEGYDGSAWTTVGGGPSADTESQFRIHKRQTREAVVLWVNNNTFTTDYSSDANQIDVTGHPYDDGDMVYVETTGTLPTGLSEDTPYYVVNSAADSVELATSFGGTPVTLTADGSGTHTIYEPVTSITGTIDVESDGSVTVKSGSEWIIV